jgi:hypothetical protein
VKQQSLASQAVFEKYGRKSRRELFLDEMEQVVPWSGLQSLVEPHYAKAGNGRRPVGLGVMLRTYFVQQWFNLSDPGGGLVLFVFAVVLQMGAIIFALRLDHDGCEDGNSGCALDDMPAEGFPGVEACHPARRGTLPEDSHLVRE